MDKENQRQARSLKANYERSQARKRLQVAINTLQRAMHDLEVFQEKFDEAANDAERAQLLNSAVNHLTCNILPNCRIDLLANSQAELTVLAERGAVL